MGYEIVGRAWDVSAFREHLKAVDTSWADSVTIHHTASPSLAQRPDGWTAQHMRNLQNHYENILGWSAGPHLFTDDEHQVFGMSSLWRRGVHARSFNKHSIGIEMLGDYDNESPADGRGLQVIENTARFVAVILGKMKLAATNDTILFHRDDPKTSKTCPGKLIQKDWFIQMVRDNMVQPADMNLEERITRIENHLGLS